MHICKGHELFLDTDSVHRHPDLDAYAWGKGIPYIPIPRHRDQTVSHHLSPSRRDRHQTLFLVTVNNCIKRQHRFALDESLLRRLKRREKRYDQRRCNIYPYLWFIFLWLRLYASTERFRDRCYRLASKKKDCSPLDSPLRSER